MEVHSLLDSKKAAIYCRASGSTNLYPGSVSLETQINICTEHCEKNGYTLVQVIREFCSGRNNKQLHDFVFSESVIKPDILIVYDITRFSRSVSEGLNLYSKLMEKKIELQSIMDRFSSEKQSPDLDSIKDMNEKNVAIAASPEVRFVALLHDSERQLEGITEKNKQSLVMRREKGHAFGKVPYGMREYRDKDNVRLFENESYETSVLRFIRTARKGCKLADLNEILKKISKNVVFEPIVLDDNDDEIRNGLSCENIAELLNEYEVPYKGRTWEKKNVYAVSSR